MQHSIHPRARAIGPPSPACQPAAQSSLHTCTVQERHCELDGGLVHCVMSPFPSGRPALPADHEKHEAEVEDVRQQVLKWGNQPPPRCAEAQRVFKNQLVERYQAAVPGHKLRCMITGAELPWGQCQAGHILSLATFEEASRRGLLKFADSHDVRNGILWAGKAQGSLASCTASLINCLRHSAERAMTYLRACVHACFVSCRAL